MNEDKSNKAGKGPGTRLGSRNDVALAGRVTTAAAERALPSGDSIITFRMSMTRDGVRARGSGSSVDWVDCVARTARARRAVGGWAAGDRVEVDGALRRRFFPGEARVQTRLEVEVLAGRRVR